MFHSIRTGTGRTALKGALAAALLASTALVAPNEAFATAATQTAAGTTRTFQAPFLVTSSAPVFGYGTAARFSINMDGTAGSQDGMELVAFLYGADNSYIGVVRSGAAVGAASATKTATVNLPSQAGGGNYTQVVFGLVYRGDEGGAGNVSDDTLDGVAANRSVLILRPGGTARNGFTVASYDVGAAAAYTTANGATTAQLNAIGAQTNFNTSTNRASVVSTYTGPVLQSVGKDAIQPGQLRLTFNAALADINNDTDVSACVQAQAGSTTNGVPTARDGLGQGGTFNMAAGDNRFYVRNGTGAFTTAIDNVDILFGGCSTVTDEAGNTAVSSSNTTVTTYAAPAYATTNTGQLAIVQATGMDVRTLWTTVGVTPNNQTLTVDLRLSEALSTTNLNAIGDFSITGLSTHTFNAATTSGNNVRLTLNINPGNVATHRIRFNRSNGRLQYSTDSGTTFTDVTIGLAVETGSAVQSIEGTALGTSLTAQNVVAGLVPTIASTNISTRDAVTNSNTSTTTPDGRLDGLTVDFGAPIGTLGTGPQIFASATSTVLASTFALDASDSTKAHGLITNPTATNDWDGNGTANEAADNTLFNTTANFATDATGNTVRFRYAQLSTGTTRYAFAYNPTDGAQLGLTAIGTGLTVDVDGAGPVLQSATVRQNAADTANGRIELNFSEAMDVSGNQKTAFIATNTGNLALDMLNAGLTAITDAGTAGTTTSQVLVNGVPNSILANITSIGIAAANTAGTLAGGAFVENATNKTPAAAVTVTPTNTALAVGPTIQNGAAIVDNSQNMTGILLFLSKDATATVASGASLAQRFNVDLTGATACALDDIPVSSATVSGSVVTLTLQSPGIGRRAIEGCNINVDYVNNSTTYLADSSGNRLSKSGTDTTNGADDDDNEVTKPVYSANTWTQEIRGQITTDGTTTVPQGTLVRADLVRYRNVREIGSVVVNLPTGERDVMVDPTGLTAANFDTEDTLNSTTFDADITVTRAANQPSTVSATIAYAGDQGASTGNAGAGQTKYRVQVNRTTGAISGTITGTVNLRSAVTSIQSRDAARYAVTDAQGRYRVNVGTNFPGGSPFVLLSVKRPGQDWVLVTQADQSFSNHIPFGQDIALASGSGPNTANVAFNTATGQNGATTLNVDLSKIRTQGFAATATANQYQLVGLPGQWSRNASRLGDFRVHRFLTTIDKSTGAPVALWTPRGNLTTTDDTGSDEAFILSANTARSAFELQRTNVDTMGGNFVAGLGLAWNDNQANRGVNERNIYYPISTTTVLPASLGAGWHLITYNGSSALTNIGSLGGSTVATQRVDMVIEVGGGNQARTWLRSQAADDGQRNTLTSLQPGQAYFVYLSAGVPAFTYQ